MAFVSRLSLGAIVLMSSLVMSSCDRGVRMEISGKPGHPIVSFSNGQLLSNDPPCFTLISVRPASSDHGSLMWSISSAPKCVKLSSIEYGSQPDGFRVITAPKALDPGEEYVVHAVGHGWLGHAKFKFENNKYVVIK